MRTTECPRESDVLDAVASKRWPDRVSSELADHAASCSVCRDVATVAGALRAEFEATWVEAELPSSGQVWWRAEMRARQEAVRQASAPIAIAQVAAAVVIAVLTAAAGRFVWTWMHRQDVRFDLGPPPAPITTLVVTMTSPLGLLLAIAFFALIVVAPLAFYLVTSDDS